MFLPPDGCRNNQPLVALNNGPVVLVWQYPTLRDAVQTGQARPEQNMKVTNKRGLSMHNRGSGKSLSGWPSCAAAAVLFGAAAAVPQPTRADWSFERERGGGYARQCTTRGSQEICAVVFCGRGVDNIQVGLTGWEPRGQGAQRSGAIRVDGRGRYVEYVLDRNPIIGDVWRVEMDRGERRLIERIKGGLELSVDIAARAPAFTFTLDGSNDAISALERRCNRGDRGERTAARDDRNPGRFDAGRRYDGGPRISVGSDDFGFEFSVTEDGIEIAGNEANRLPGVPERGWTELATTRVDRRRDRDVVDLGRDEGRFTALRMKALRNDIRLRRVMVRYGNGVEHEVDVDRILEQGNRSGIIRLRGRQARFIDRITLVYDTRGRGQRAELKLWGRRT